MSSNDACFILDTEEMALTKKKNTSKSKLAFAVMLKFFQIEGRYPTNKDIIHKSMLDNIMVQLNCPEVNLDNYDWETRTTARFRGEIRTLLGYRKTTSSDSDKLITWLVEQNIFSEAPTLPQSQEKAYKFFAENKLEPFSPSHLDRCISRAHYKFEQKLFSDIEQQLSYDAKNTMEALLEEDIQDVVKDKAVDETKADSTEIESEIIKLNDLKKDIAGAKLKNVDWEISKLTLLKELSLPTILELLPRKLKQKYYMRIAAAPPSGIKEYKPRVRYANMAMFCHFRSELITDNLVDTFVQLIHKMRTSAEIFINKSILKEVACVDGKFDILYILADTSAYTPYGVIENTIYPKVSQETLVALSKELKSKKISWYQYQVQKKMHSLYSHAHRKELIRILETLGFKTNNPDCCEILKAIEFIKEHKDIDDKYYPRNKALPALKIIPPKWKAMIAEEVSDKEGSSVRMNRANYEIAILEILRVLLGCKQIWVEGAYRYRDPEEDFPKNFEENLESFLKKLNWSLDPEDFINLLQQNLNLNLTALNDTILSNKKVKIALSKNKKDGEIKVTPYTAKIEPDNSKLQRAINSRWSMINLIDILKEADLRLGFTKHFNTIASRENISWDKLHKRLLLSIYGLGSNAGLKRISSANDDASYSDLRYIKRRFINVPNVRQAIIEVVNNILEIRDPRIWGAATTGCACDSTKVSVWDQNLMTEWHIRYNGRGVMIYWHVDMNAACVYSQLKTCSSSEVGAMIKGVLDHCTKMDMQKGYVDTHGQSTVGFAISYLLHFDLLPRLKDIKHQKLYYSSPQDKDAYKNLDPVLKSSINWNLIKKYYYEVMKYVAALRCGNVEPEVMFKMLSNDNYKHPVYKALTEIGHAVKTIFLCRYLMFEELRMEIHDALNVVERLNSIMGFIFYGKLGEISTNNRGDQELAVACLHLLQVCMVYINTLIIQEVLSDQTWKNKLTAEDKRGLTPLIHKHINPYGLFPLDLNTRVVIERKVAA